MLCSLYHSVRALPVSEDSSTIWFNLDCTEINPREILFACLVTSVPAVNTYIFVKLRYCLTLFKNIKNTFIYLQKDSIFQLRIDHIIFSPVSPHLRLCRIGLTGR